MIFAKHWRIMLIFITTSPNWQRRFLQTNVPVLLQRVGCLRALQTEQSKMRGGIDQLDLVGDDVALESLRDGIEQAGFEVEDQLVVEALHVQVGLHPGLGVDERGVAALAQLEPGDLVGDLAVDEFHPIVTQYGKTASKGKIDEGNGLSQRPIFGVRVAVFLGDTFAGDVAKLRALLVKIGMK